MVGWRIWVAGLAVLCLSIAPAAASPDTEATVPVEITVLEFVEIHMTQGAELQLSIDGLGEHESNHVDGQGLKFDVKANAAYTIELRATNVLNQVPFAELTSNGNSVWLAYEATLHLAVDKGIDTRTRTIGPNLDVDGNLAGGGAATASANVITTLPFSREMAIDLKSNPAWVLSPSHLDLVPAGTYETTAVLEIEFLSG